MSAPPYMKLYIADYLADTTHLSRSEHGAYLLLLMAMWRAGGKLPNKDEKLAAIAKASPKEWAALRPTMLEFFAVSGGSLRHKRLGKELAHYSAVVERRKAAGKRTHSENGKENNEQAGAFAPEKNSKSPHNQNQNQNHKGRLEASKKASKSSRRVTADERAEGSSPSRSESQVVVDLDALRAQLAEDERRLQGAAQ
jgi:uncharacterized protein YdaU (DUF1376 family)